MPDHSPIFSLPLFTLGSVHFPHILLQLHVFEERYRVMINGCIERNEPFGVVLIREGNEVGTPATPHEVGCVARIHAVQRFSDGRMLLHAICNERFRILDYVEAELPYLIGKVELIEDEPADEEAMQEDARILAHTFARYLAALAEQTGMALPQVEVPADPALMAYYVAYVALLPATVKQRLLEMTDPHARLREETRLLERALDDLTPEDASDTVDPETAEQEAGESPSALQVVIARPIDPAEEDWKRYLEENRN